MKNYSLLIFFLAFTSFFILWLTGLNLSASVNSSVGEPPADLKAQNVVFKGVHGWFVPANNNDYCILLMHGIRSDRRAMIDRARFLKNAGYASFLIDLQAHGETPGEKITFGYLESESARLAIDFLRINKQCQKVASIGQSLGGAASLLGQKPLNVDAYILEAVYPTIEDAIRNRFEVRMGGLAHVVAPLYYFQIPVRLGIPLDALRPVDAIKNVKAPVLIISGDKDRYTTISDSSRLFANAPAPKKLWAIERAGHTDFYKFSPEQYKHTVLAFLSTHIVNDAYQRP